MISCLVLTMLWLAVCLPRRHGPIDLRWDASVYFILGTALAEGKGYRLLNEPGEIEAIQYPPLLPLVVAAHQRVVGTSDYLAVAPRLRLFYLGMAGVFLAAAYALARSMLPPQYALIVCALTALSFDSYLHPSDTLYAELPFAAASTLFLVCHRRSGGFWACATAGLGVAAYLLRTAGIALLAAWVAESLIRRQWRRAALRAAVSALPVLAWQAHVWQVQASDAYRQPAYAYQRAPYYYANVSYAENSRLVDPFRPDRGRTSALDWPVRVLGNITAVPAALGETIWIDANSPRWFEKTMKIRLGLEMPPRRFFHACLVLLGGMVVAGAALLVVGGQWFLPMYFGTTIGLIVLTPWPEQFWRYLAVLAPASGIFLVQALLEIEGRLAARGSAWARLLGSTLVTLPLGGMLLVQAPLASKFLRHLLPVSYYDAGGNEIRSRLLSYEPPWHELDFAFEWLRQHARAGDVIATTVPHLAYVRSGHKAVLHPMESDPESVRRLLDEVPVKFVVLDELSRPDVSERYAAPAIEHRPDQWRLAFTTPGGATRVYERIGAVAERVGTTGGTR